MMRRDHTRIKNRREVESGQVRIIERFVSDESGMTMGLAVIMIVLIGVMGAGLLTFVSRDLNTVVEVNQGQRAFEMADAGVQAAKEQVRDEDPDPKHYGGSDGNTGDIPWAESQGGKDLSMEGANANVKIKSDTPYAGYYMVTSTGCIPETSGDTGCDNPEQQRKIEAILHSSGALGGGRVPAWYSPGSMRLKKDATANGMSYFSGGNIIFKSGGSFGDTNDVLGDWNNPPYNTVPRKDASGAPYTKAGFAAEGFVCDQNNCNAGTSIADGVRIYDSTTGTKGNKKKFVEKVPPTYQPQDENTITYPFSREINVDGLLERAQSGSPNLYLTSADSNIPDSTEKRIVFVDANGETVDFSKGGDFNGVLVVRCGNLNMNKEMTFTGIIIVIKGDGAGCGSTGKVNFKKDFTMKGPIYADSDENGAIDGDKNAAAYPLPAGYEELVDLAYTSSVEVISWRELYQ